MVSSEMLGTGTLCLPSVASCIHLLSASQEPYAWGWFLFFKKKKYFY